MTRPIELPVELLDTIISTFWHSQLSNDDRITFMTSSMLVGKMWRELFLRVSSIDVHFPSASYVRWFGELLDRSSSLSRRISDSCLSFTLAMESACDRNAPHLLQTDEHPASRAFADLLSNIQTGYYDLPHLRTVSVEYINPGLLPIVDSSYQNCIPAQVTSLHLALKMTKDLPSFLISTFRDFHMDRCLVDFDPGLMRFRRAHRLSLDKMSDSSNSSISPRPFGLKKC